MTARPPTSSSSSRPGTSAARTLEGGFAEYLEQRHIAAMLRALMTVISVERPVDLLPFVLEQLDTLELLDLDNDIEWCVVRGAWRGAGAGRQAM